MQSWSVSDSLKLYSIENWGNQFFNINPTGNLTVYPKKGEGPGVDIVRIIEDVRSRGLQLPCLVRFQDMMQHQVVNLNETFKKTIEEAKYKGRYQGVYPIKVNQMREVVEEIIEAGKPYQFGLEAGSKAELCAVIAMDLDPDCLIICNGYKDYEFVKIALMGRKLGKRVILVVEKLSELDQIIRVAKELKVKPHIGIRAKLTTRGSGKWETSSGDFAKFGLSAPEMIEALRTLKEADLEDSFKLLHFHIGSQITDIRTIKDAVKEATRIYAKLKKMGLDELQFLDVGGGLGIDYDGSQTNFESSINYTQDQYVADVVYSIQEICQAEDVKEPNIVSESGRAIVAHHSVLVVDVFGSIEVDSGRKNVEIKKKDDDIVHKMKEVLDGISIKNLLESYQDALQTKDEALSMFKLGILSLEARAKVEQLFWQICHIVYRRSRELRYIPEDLVDLGTQLADQYLCNFSVFQSMIDHWAIQALFPVVPLHRLNEKPEREATLVDITCDSDGKVKKFIDLKDVRDTLPVHPLNAGEPYYLGFFLMGAYQDVMGDLHNLFGQVNEVHVFLDESEPGGYYIEEVIPGNSVSEILSWIQYSSPTLRKTVKSEIDARVRDGKMRPRQGVELQKFYEKVLNGYTYMDVYSEENAAEQPMRKYRIYNQPPEDLQQLDV